MQDSAQTTNARTTAGMVGAALIALSAIAMSPATAAAATAPSAKTVVDAVAARTTQVTGYTAALSVHVTMHSFPFLRMTVHGDMRYRQPGQYDVTMHTLPAIAKAFQNVSGDAGDPDTWLRKYDVAIDTDAPRSQGQITLRLTPKSPAQVNHAEAYIDSASMTVSRMEWYYERGGTIFVDDHYTQIGDVLMIDRQTAEIAMDGVRATATADLSNYALQTDVAASAAAQSVDK